MSVGREVLEPTVMAHHDAVKEALKDAEFECQSVGPGPGAQ